MCVCVFVCVCVCVLYDVLHIRYNEVFLLSQIFRCILSLRCNDLYQLGYQDETSLQFTPFFTCRAPDEATPTEHAPTLLDYRSAFNIILACLEKVNK